MKDAQHSHGVLVGVEGDPRQISRAKKGWATDQFAPLLQLTISITTYYIILHHITSYYIILHHITSYYIILHHVTSSKERLSRSQSNVMPKVAKDISNLSAKDLLDHFMDLRPGPLFVHHSFLADIRKGNLLR